MEFLVNEDLAHVSGSAPPLSLSGDNPNNLWFVLLLSPSSVPLFTSSAVRVGTNDITPVILIGDVIKCKSRHCTHRCTQTNAVKMFLPQNSSYCKSIQFSLLLSLVIILWISLTKYFGLPDPVTLIDGSRWSRWVKDDHRTQLNPKKHDKYLPAWPDIIISMLIQNSWAKKKKDKNSNCS